MNPRPDVTEQRIAQIIEAATTIFAEKGLDAATMDDIAEAVGINKATIYLYFDNKDALIGAIAEAIFTQELADLHAIVAAPGTAIERLTTFYEAMIADEAHVLPLMPVLYEFYALGLRRDDVRTIISGFLRQSAGLLTTILEEGIENGDLAPTDAHRAARALDALLSGTILHWVYAPDEMDVSAQFRYGVRLIFRGLIAQADERH